MTGGCVFLDLVLAANTGVSADLTAPAGANWSTNGAGTTWKYRDPLASSGILSATVKAIQPAGTLRVPGDRERGDGTVSVNGF